MRLQTALRLGRVSNLPTVWTNTMAGAMLAAGMLPMTQVGVMIVAFSLFYVGGMFLNDAFDAGYDAVHRPQRPIPAGDAGRGEVFGIGYGLMAVGLGLLAWVGFGTTPGTGAWPIVGGIALGAAITFYNWHHKANPLGPLVMGLCRVLVYVGAGWGLVTVLPPELWIGAALLLCYLIGLTYIAKQEDLARFGNLWPLGFLAAPVVYGLVLGAADTLVLVLWLLFTGWIVFALWLLRRRRPGDIGRAVVSLIAGISLLDAVLLAGAGAVGAAMFALAAFALTLVLQRWIKGT